MELSLSISAATLFTICFFSLFLSIFWRNRHDKKKKLTVPEASGSWPILGHLHLLRGPEPAHIVLAGLADKFGPIFSIRLGVHRAIVVNTWEIAKECLTTHDLTFATRPKSVGSEVLSYNYGIIGMSPYSPYWRYARKISTVKLLSNHRIDLLRHVRESEVHASIKDTYIKWRDRTAPATTALVDMKRWFGDITLNVIFKMIVGKRFISDGGSDEKGRQALRDWFDLSGRFVVSDAIPLLRWLDIGGYEREMRKTGKELDRVFQGWLDEHKENLQSGKEEEEEGDNESQDLMDVLLSETLQRKNEDISHTYGADTVIKAISMTMVLGGSDTTTVSLTWALSLLLNNKESLTKVQQELDTIVGRDRQVKESDLENLPYLQAIIKETFRLYPAAPMAIPHEATQDCILSTGYFVPKGTRLFLNLYKIQRDPRVWPDPNEFKPERFLTTHTDIDFRGQNFEYLPFGSGRRMCPGTSMGVLLVGLSLASFLHAFEVETREGEAVDMAESIGLTNLKASPLQVLVKPRLPDFIYQ